MELVYGLVNEEQEDLPYEFAELIDHGKLLGVSQEELNSLLAGPEHPDYWDAWASVLTNAVIKWEGKWYYLYQNGSLYMYREPENNAERVMLSAFFKASSFVEPA